MTINTAANLRSHRHYRGRVRFLRAVLDTSPPPPPSDPFPLILERRLAVSGAIGLGVDPWH